LKDLIIELENPCDQKKVVAYGKLPYPSVVGKVNELARLEARLPVALHAMLKRAAEIEGRTLTDFVVSAARDAAERTIEGAEILRLSMEDQMRVAEALMDPPAPTDALKKAFEQRKRLLLAE
jgi:uncharacterized protein (DUF1778 family)